MKTVILRGPLLSLSGYGVHSRQIARWLFDLAEQEDLDITCECLPWGNTPWITDMKFGNGLAGQIVQSTTKTKPFYDVSIQIQLPNEWNPFLASYNVGVTAGVETDVCQKDWVLCVNRMQKVIVPSLFTKQTFENTGKVTTPIEVIPESFPDSFLLNDKKLDFDLGTDFNFLVVGQLAGNNPDSERKNTLYTMKWFSEVFAGNPNVGLVIKTNAGRHTHLDKNIVVDIFNRTLVENRLQTPNGPKFYLLHGNMTEEEMGALYTHPKIKALLALTKGEGFGLPLLEAAVKELPIIATNWSAHTEFLPTKKWLPVSYKLDTIHPSRVDAIFPSTAKWAYPDEQDAKRRMLKFYEEPSMPKRWAQEASTQLKKSHSHKTIAEMYTSSFRGCLC